LQPPGGGGPGPRGGPRLLGGGAPPPPQVTPPPGGGGANSGSNSPTGPHPGPTPPPIRHTPQPIRHTPIPIRHTPIPISPTPVPMAATGTGEARVRVTGREATSDSRRLPSPTLTPEGPAAAPISFPIVFLLSIDIYHTILNSKVLHKYSSSHTNIPVPVSIYIWDLHK
jgi:hypothetical protein